MKNCLAILACFFAVGLILNLNLQVGFNGDEKSQITLRNVEALAGSESYGKLCEFLGSVDCPNSSIKVLYLE